MWNYPQNDKHSIILFASNLWHCQLILSSAKLTLGNHTIELHKRIIKISTLKVSLEFLATHDSIWYLGRSLNIPGRYILTENGRMVSKSTMWGKYIHFVKRYKLYFVNQFLYWVWLVTLYKWNFLLKWICSVYHTHKIVF